MADKAHITPKVLKWARESARMSLETAAAKALVAPEKLRDWEEGTAQPTIRQAEKLAKSYRRPFALFFLPEIPRDFHPLQDFRRKTAKPLGTASIFIIREIQQKQAWISEAFAEEDITVPFVGSFSPDSNPLEVAANILDVLQIDPANYKTENPIREWIEKAESKGIFISRTSFIHSRLKLDSEEIQGFAISDAHAPFVFVNSNDWNAPQLFTLVHELAHIWIAASGISNDIELEVYDRNKVHPVELFCNQVAANALMPLAVMDNLNQSVFNSGSDVFRAAKKLGISSFAFLLRAFHLQLISKNGYWRLKNEVDSEFRAFLKKEEEKKARQKKSEGGPDYYRLLVNKNGQLFTQVVMDAYRSGTIPPTEASSLLSTQINNFPKLEAFLYK